MEGFRLYGCATARELHPDSLSTYECSNAILIMDACSWIRGVDNSTENRGLWPSNIEGFKGI